MGTLLGLGLYSLLVVSAIALASSTRRAEARARVAAEARYGRRR